MKEQYNINRLAKIGDSLKCPSCNSNFKKLSYNQIFCKTKVKTICKDHYWNTITPTKRNNQTRISSASQAWIDIMREKELDDTWGLHPFSSEGIGQCR